MVEESPLFLQLRRDLFEDFEKGKSKAVWRPYGTAWNEQNCYAGRRVIMSLGICGRRLHGVIAYSRLIKLDGAAAPGAPKEFFELHIEVDRPEHGLPHSYN